MTLWRGKDPLILASQSRARRVLLANAGIDFEAVPALLDERAVQQASDLSDPGDIAALLAREKSLYCSALVQHLFGKIGFDLTPGIKAKNTTPEDIFRTSIPHTTYLLDRQLGESKIKAMTVRLRGKIRTKIKGKETSEPRRF